MKPLLILAIFFLLPGLNSRSQNLYEIKSGTVSFRSEAPLENIEASSNKLKGVINLTTNSFAFSVDVASFEGFNSALQKEHFNENYLESDVFPKATFTGKLIDIFDPSKTEQSIRAKGKLEIHGVVSERIIKVTLKKSSTGYELSTDFNVLLQDHGIVVPKIVHQKISESIAVSVRSTMVLKP